MVLALAEEFARSNAVELLRVTAQDISRVACDMAYVNLCLWGVPAHIIWGDTLRNTVNTSWKNVHWARVGEDQRLVMKKAFDLVGQGMGERQVECIEVGAEVKAPEQDVQQQWLFGGPDVS